MNYFFQLSLEPEPVQVAPDVEAGSEAESETTQTQAGDTDEGLLNRLETDAAQASKSQAQMGGTSRGKKRTQYLQEEEWLREISDSMKGNTELLAQLVRQKPSSPRKLFITYVSETLRELPNQQYEDMKRKITSLLLHTEHSSSYDPAATAMPSQSHSMPPQNVYQAYPQYQQQQVFQQKQYPNFHQYQQQQYQQHQSTQQRQQPNTSRQHARSSAENVSQILASTNDVLDDSLSQSLSGLDTSVPSLSSLTSLSTSPAPQVSGPSTPQQ